VREALGRWGGSALPHRGASSLLTGWLSPPARARTRSLRSPWRAAGGGGARRARLDRRPAGRPEALREPPVPSVSLVCYYLVSNGQIVLIFCQTSYICRPKS